MNHSIGIFIGIILFGLFLYFGYRDDYKRDPKTFIKSFATLFIVLLTFIVVIQLSKMDNLKNNNISTPQHINTKK